MRKRLCVVIAIEGVIIAGLLIVALDQYAHAQTEMTTGLNTWGYRGDVVPARVPNETRLLFAGGTRAFEPGVPLNATIAAGVAFRVEYAAALNRGPVRAINIALENLPRGAYGSRLESFRALAPDVICLLVDLIPSPDPWTPGLVTQATGYMPALRPLQAIDRTLARALGRATPAGDSVDDVVAAVSTARSIAPVVVAIPDATTADESRERAELIKALSALAADANLTVVALESGAPVTFRGVVQPAAAAQLAPAIDGYVRAALAAETSQ